MSKTMLTYWVVSVLLLCLILSVLPVSCSDEENPSIQDSPSPILTQTGTPQDTETPTVTATMTVTGTPSPSWTPTVTMTMTPGSNTAPETTITSGPDVVTTFPVAFYFSGEDAEDPDEMLQYTYRMDEGEWSSWQQETTATYHSLADGDHVFAVKARDSEGLEDKSPALWPFTVDIYNDAEAPDTWITSSPDEEIYTDTATFTYAGSDNDTAAEDLLFSYLFDNDDWTAFSSKTEATITNLAEGDHSFAVRAKDEAGNIDPTPDQVAFTVKFYYYAISLEPAAQSQYTEPGAEAIFRIDITNTGTRKATFIFNLLPDVPADWSASYCLSTGQCIVGTAEIVFQPGQTDFMTIHIFSSINAQSDDEGRAKLTAVCKADSTARAESKVLVVIL
ncbi:hypothetical protein ACFL27_26510 [candidate division CSSED10-310 bacterium]|uniref:DUF11 domain-containing protein n=1 Tax=candidate division CSSED10-310 bacterium TaxID=2855610 RepID=A0ABV6Z5N7_UNCC1